MIYLITGNPGSGKTALALDRAFKLQKEGRTIYAHGIKDLDYERAGFQRFPDDDPSRWQELPDGSVCLVDECYSAFPNRNVSSRVPDHVEALARHRHRGFDFILVAQQGLQLDPFMRGLYETHEHVKKKFGKWAEIRRWSSYQGNVNGHCADKENWIRPAYVFTFYTSTVADTTKNRVPTWLRWTAILLAFVAGVTWYLKAQADARIAEGQGAAVTAVRPAADAPSGAGARAAAGPTAPPVYESPGDYAQAHLARFPSMPWTAPVYDHRPVTADPLVVCASTMPGTLANGEHAEGSCSCLTEQGTPYELSEPECRRVARFGPPYNPYRTRAVAASTAPAGAYMPTMPVSDAPSTTAIRGRKCTATASLASGRIRACECCINATNRTGLMALDTP